MLGPKIIIDTNISLREFHKDDTVLWLKWNNDKDLQKYMPEPFEVRTIQDENEFLEEATNEDDGIYWTIEDSFTSRPIGIVSVTEISQHHGLGELGIIIGEKEYHGKGIASKVIEGVLDYCKNKGLRRITAEYEEGNIGLQKALEKNSFILEAKCIDSRIKKGLPINTFRYYKLF
jgi:ribosomal-protein-alanine N-acetyltransferase